MGRLDGKVAIITGGNSGIGAAIAHRFACEGAAGVLIAGIDVAQASDVVEAIARDGGHARSHPTDVTSPEQAEAMVAAAVAEWGRLDILVNNAARTNTLNDMAVTHQSLDEWTMAFDVNVTGAMLCSKYAIPAMIASGGGAIVNSSSGLGVLAEARWSAYSCSKAALIRLSQHMAAAYGSQGVRSNVMILGMINTPALDHTPEAVRTIMARNHLVGRFGTVEEVAKVAAFLASDEASFITGAEIVVDGGLSAHVPQMVQMQDWAASLA